MRSIRYSTALLLTLVVLASPPVAANDELWALLKRGDQVVLFRHSVTTPGLGDPPGMRLEDCATQRNLSDEGRAHAKRVGEAFRARRIPVGRVQSSPWCRCLETARLAFGRADIEPALGNLFERQENRERNIALLRPVAGERPKSGNLVLVTHGSTITALADVSVGMGELVVLTPQGAGRFTVAGRLVVP